jgi:acetyl-CoA carboxylase carboxyl transferase subunit beta
MPVRDWFKARDDRRGYTRSNGTPGRSEAAKGAWHKCDDCGRIMYGGEYADNLCVCPYCDHHMAMPARERVASLVDPATFEEIDAELSSGDPLGFTTGTPYADKLAETREKTGLNEAIVVGRGQIGGTPVVVGAMDFRFIGASMGSAVGEKVARAFELATAERLPVVLAIASGGARMQEGMLSLMQMAKTSAAVARHDEAGLGYVAVLTHPTTGGVTASFATLADLTLAEPGARVGFTGPRIIEQNTQEKLPKDFQTAESMLGHGMIDEVVPRETVASRVAEILGYLAPREDGSVA